MPKATLGRDAGPATILRAAIGALLVALALVGCGEDVGEIASPDIVASPEAVSFDAANVGEVQFRTFRVFNRGAGFLEVASLSFLGDATVLTVEVPAVTFPLRLAPEDGFDVTVTYLPNDGTPLSGEVVVASNDRDTPTLRIPILVQQLGARLRVSPSPVQFGRVPVGRSREREVTMENIGNSPLTVTGIELAASSEFAILDTFSFPLVVPAGGQRTFGMRYVPTMENFAEGFLIFRSDDTGSETQTVRVNANGAVPCIEVSDEAGWDFGSQLIGGTGATREFTIRNCSSRTQGEVLEIAGLSLVPEEAADPAGPFVATGSAVEAFARDGGLSISPGDVARLTVRFDPAEAATSRATLAIDSNDEEKAAIRIPLRGTGFDNRCPVAVATCWVVEQGVLPSDELSALPLQTVDCSATASFDEDGESIAGYLWEVVERPDGSTTSFQPAPNLPNASVFLDLAGEYTIELSVYDARGEASCEPSRVRVLAQPDEDIHVQVVWETPSDPDPTDTCDRCGSDVDVHFRSRLGTWAPAQLRLPEGEAVPPDLRWDCHFRNRSPDWGRPLDPSDDPSVDRDDTDGAGPENINLNNPEDGAVYDVGVQYFDDKGFGASFVTVRVYVQGQLAWQSPETSLTRKGEFWHAATIRWTGGTGTVEAPAGAPLLYDDLCAVPLADRSLRCP